MIKEVFVEGQYQTCTAELVLQIDVNYFKYCSWNTNYVHMPLFSQDNRITIYKA